MQPEQLKVTPEEAKPTIEAEKKLEETKKQVLNRQLSTPASFRPSNNDNIRDAVEAEVVEGETVTATDKHRKSLNRLHRFRHSHCERTVRQLCLGNPQDENKSATSSSSSASDSAFSQSRTTLESESEQSNCFRRSSKDSSFSKEQNGSGCRLVMESQEDSFERDEPNGEPEDGAELETLDNQFKIIWKNLSYRVPDKRFSRVSAYLARQREALWPSTLDNDETIEDTPPLQSDPDKPPMRAPTAGKPRKVIFSHLDGCVKSGELTAILGPSGAGKTTFLKCLTNSIVKGVSGSINITGCQATSHHLKLCIIPQKDYLFDNLTVMENLLFASRIKNTKPHNFDHLQNVDRVVNLLGLQTCLKLKTNKLSGGQYKRVSIAQELLSKPDILILDEPTSGLDSLTCFRTVSVLRDLVNMSRIGLMPPLAIIMTIHQPQIKIFNLFHHVYILSSMGQCVYEGRPEYLINTVADCCKLLPPSDDLNPASFIIDLASEVYGTEPIKQLINLQRENSNLIHPELIGNTSSSASNKNNNLSQIELIVDSNVHKANTKASHRLKFDDDGYPEELEDDSKEHLIISDRLRRRNTNERNFWVHTGLLVKRLWISMWRDPLLTTTRVTFHLIIPFVFYFIYSQKSGAANACPHVEREFDFQNLTSEESVQRLEVQHNELILTFENVSLFFLLLYSFSMCVLAVTALSFPLNMQILLKETSNGWYSMSRFVMAKTLADLPMELTMPMISVSLAYVLTGQPSSYLCWRMLTVTAVMTLCSLISQTQGLLFGAYFMNNVQAAVFVSQASSLPWIMLSGFTTRVSELPKVLQWLSFGSIYRLGIESIVSVRYGFGMCPCDQELVDDTPARVVGIPDQLRSVVRYYLDAYSEPSTNNATGDIFEKIATTLSRANTFGLDIVTCHDVRPFILSAREVDEGTLPTFLLILLIIFVGLKISLFYVVGLRAG